MLFFPNKIKRCFTKIKQRTISLKQRTILLDLCFNFLCFLLNTLTSKVNEILQGKSITF